MVGNASGTQYTTPASIPTTTRENQAPITIEHNQTDLPTNEKYWEVLDGEKLDSNDGLNVYGAEDGFTNPINRDHIPIQVQRDNYIERPEYYFQQHTRGNNKKPDIGSEWLSSKPTSRPMVFISIKMPYVWK